MIIRPWALTLYLVFCLPLWPQTAPSFAPESIEIQSVLFSRCTDPQQRTNHNDLQPIRVLYQALGRVGERASYQYWALDLGCKKAVTGSGSATVEQFENAKERLEKAGMREGKTIAPPESSGNEWPVSFLRLQTQGKVADVYTMYLAYRWSGKMQTEDPVAGRIIELWRSLMEEIASTTSGGVAQRVDIAEIVRGCANGWPSGIRRWVWNSAQTLVPQQSSHSDCSVSFGHP